MQRIEMGAPPPGLKRNMRTKHVDAPPPPAFPPPATDGTEMFVQLLRTCADPKLTGQTGQIFSVAGEHGRALIAQGIARPVSQEEFSHLLANPPSIEH